MKFFNFIEYFKRLKLLKPPGEGKTYVRGDYSTDSLDNLARRAVDKSLSRVLSNMRGFDAGSVFPNYAGYLGSPMQGAESEDMRAIMDSGYTMTEVDVDALQRYYAANMICYAVRRYRFARYNDCDFVADVTSRREYLTTAVDMLSLACEIYGFSPQYALKKFAQNPKGLLTAKANGNPYKYEDFQNIFYREIRDLLRAMSYARGTGTWYSPFEEWNDLIYECFTLMFRMLYSADEKFFLQKCGQVYKAWGIKLRGECADEEVPDALR